MPSRSNTPAAITILGSGHTGHALAGSFSLAGYPTTLVSLSQRHDSQIDFKAHSGIRVIQNKISHFCPVRCTQDISQAISSADIIFCTTPALHHNALINRLLPLIKNGQTLYFSSYFGGLKMLSALANRPELTDITIVESMSSIHAARSHQYGHVEIIASKDEVPVATYPENHCAAFLRQVKKAMPHLTPAESILSTSLNNVGPILHVPLMLFSVARIEATQGTGWNLYQDGMTPSVERSIKQLDYERLLIAEHLDVPVRPLEETMLTVFYKNQGVDASDFFSWIRDNNIHATDTIGAPSHIENRYLTEGVYYGLKPLSHLAKQLGITTPLIDASINMTNALLPASTYQEESHADYLTLELIEQLLIQRKQAV
jgi:opine dehydrogenase